MNKINSEKVLILFYTSWCPHCKELLSQLNKLYKNQREKKYEILAISLDTNKENWQNFSKENCSSIINISDLKGWDSKSANDYYIYATPTMFLIDKEKK